MSILEAINALLALTTTATNMMSSIEQISGIIQKATAENRTTLTQEEWATVINGDDIARQALVDAITKALTSKTVSTIV